MSDYRKFHRVLVEVEVEVTDPIAANAYTFDVTAEGGMLSNDNPEWHISRLVGQVLGDALVNQSEVTGVKFVNSSGFPRPKDEEGWYSEVRLPEMPARKDDGTMIMPPSWEDMVGN